MFKYRVFYTNKTCFNSRVRCYQIFFNSQVLVKNKIILIKIINVPSDVCLQFKEQSERDKIPPHCDKNNRMFIPQSIYMSRSYIPAMHEPYLKKKNPAKLHIYTNCSLCKLRKCHTPDRNGPGSRWLLLCPSPFALFISCSFLFFQHFVNDKVKTYCFLYPEEMWISNKLTDERDSV